MRTQEYTVVESKEIVWCDSDDRYILIIRENNHIVGLNFMQGDELDLFKRDFSEIDQDLTNYYNSITIYLTGNSEYDRINQAIWGWFEYRNLNDSQTAR
jgi:hypothetical protein